MTVELFLTLTTILSVVTSLITEAFKKMFDKLDEAYSANVIAAVCAVAVGLIGTSVSYIFLGISFTCVNIICAFLMSVVIWVGAMLGYDKVTQLLEQIKNLGV